MNRFGLCERWCARMVAIVVAFGCIMVGVPAQSWAQAPTLEEVRDQGVLYFKRGHHKQARVTLDDAFEMDGGPDDFRVVFYRASALYELFVFGEARKMLSRAATLAGENPNRKIRVEALRDELDNLVGQVRFEAASGGPDAGTIRLEPRMKLINKRKSRVARGVQTRFATTNVQLPTTVDLPYGEYTANDQVFEISRGEITVVKVVPVSDPSAAITGGGGGGNTWLYVGVGTAVAVAAGVGAFLLLDDGPSPERRDELLFNVNSLTHR